MDSDELLVGIINNVSDFKIIRDKHWYRIPVDIAGKRLKKRWPPKWIAFYHSGAIKNHPFLISHYAEIKSIVVASRSELFPDEPSSQNSNKIYYKIVFDKLQTLPKPILSRRWRRIVFIQTTYKKFFNAVEINDLFDESALEDKLWAELKRNKIEAERQELVQIENRFYFLDFAIYCIKGKLDIEADGDEWHHNPNAAEKDNLRNNDLSSKGWNIIRFNSDQIQEKISTYCIPKIKNSINNQGGIGIDHYFAKRFEEFNEDGDYQYNFFDYDPEE
jgi:very-short-patch-repair endonuclease